MSDDYLRFGPVRASGKDVDEIRRAFDLINAYLRKIFEQLNVDLPAAYADIDDAEAAIATLQSSLATAQSAITTLQIGLSSAQSAITTLQNTVSSHTTSITNIEGDITTIETNITNLQTDVTNIKDGDYNVWVAYSGS